MKQKYSDAELVEMIRGDSTTDMNLAMRFLYANYYGVIRSLVLKNSGEDEDVKDIFQEAIIVFVNAVKKEHFKLSSSIKTYLYAVARNVWLKELRNKPKRTSIEDIPHIAVDEEVDLKEMEQKCSRLKQLINQLKEDCRKVLIDFYYYNASIKDIMERFDLGSIQAAKNKKYRCMNYLVQLCNETQFSHGEW